MDFRLRALKLLPQACENVILRTDGGCRRRSWLRRGSAQRSCSAFCLCSDASESLESRQARSL